MSEQVVPKKDQQKRKSFKVKDSKSINWLQVIVQLQNVPAGRRNQKLQVDKRKNKRVLEQLKCILWTLLSFNNINDTFVTRVQHIQQPW